MDPYTFVRGEAATRPLWVVAIYREDRAYGGPEEGGWWYTEGELEGILDSSFDEDSAYGAAYAFNRPAELGEDYRRDGLAAHVVQLGRRELRPELRSAVCHMGEDFEPTEDDYVVRYDVPTYIPESRPHYC